MANSLFSLTPVAIQKVVGGAWNDDSAIVCHMADGVSPLTSDKAKGEFVGLLNKLGIKLVTTRNFGNRQVIEVFNANGKEQTAMTDDEKRNAISLEMFKTVDNAAMFAQFSGDVLDVFYAKTVKPSKETAPYQLYRVTLGDFVLYRVSNDNEPIHKIVHNAIRHLIDNKGQDEALFDNKDLPSNE